MENLKLCDIAGYEAEKEELMQIIAMFRDFQAYSEKGVYLAKGLIISGSPGVGKTLFAKVLANEIDAPFFYIDGAEYSGVRGVRKLKAVFEKARKKSPSIVFIDELNTFVGGYGYKSDNTKRILSTLLKLIDGIKSSDGIFIIGATSDKDDLDEALIRSGRMDKHICLDCPNYQSRRAIIDHYLSRVAFDTAHLNIKLIAEKTQGFNGADIKTLINETMLECAYKEVTPTDDLFLQHIRKIEEHDINRERDNLNLSLLAYHDLGHLIVSDTLLGQFDEVSLVYESDDDGNSSITSLFNSNDGDNDDDYDDDEGEIFLNSFDSQHTILDKVCVLLGGTATEEVFMNQRYLTCRDDLVSAVKLINAAFENGMFGFEYVNHDTYYYMEASQRMLARLERKRAEILKEQYERAKIIVLENHSSIEKLHELLLRKKALAKTEIQEMLKQT